MQKKEAAADLSKDTDVNKQYYMQKNGESMTES